MENEQATEETILNQEPTSPEEGTQPVGESDGESGQEPAAKPQGRRNDNTVPYQKFAKVNQELKALKQQQETAVQSLTGRQENDPVQNDNSEPKREEFQSDADYYRALGVWGGQQGFQQAKTQEEQQNREYQEQQRRTQAETNFAEKAVEAQKKYTNFNEALQASTTVFSDEVSLAIQASPVAGDLAYALATNPTEAQRISGLPTNEALVALGTLSAQIPGSNGQPVKMSNLPNPIQTVGTGKPSAGKPYSDDMDQSSFDDAFPFSDLE